MDLKCLFGHKWNGCECERCGKVRDKQHDWNGCECNKCGKIRPHQLSRMTCENCGKKIISANRFTKDEIGKILPILTNGNSKASSENLSDFLYNKEYYSINTLLVVRDYLASRENYASYMNVRGDEEYRKECIDLVKKITKIERELE